MPRIRSTSKSKKHTVKDIPTEYQECKTFYQYTQSFLRLGKTIIHNANEGRRDAWYGEALSRIGLTRGVCDYTYIVPNKKYHSLWLEMKRRDGYHKPKHKDQDEFIAVLRAHGHYAAYAYGWEDAVRILQAYMADEL
jgi:hypothetical protein